MISLIAGFFAFVKRRPVRSGWYALLVWTVYVQIEMVPHSVAQLAQSETIQRALHAYGILAVGVATLGAELARLQFEAKRWPQFGSALLLFLVAAVCCLQADLVTWGREANMRSENERAAFEASSNAGDDTRDARARIKALEDSAGAGGLLPVASYEAQIQAAERQRDGVRGENLEARQKRSGFETRIARLEDLKGRAARRDALKLGLAPQTQSAAPAAPRARDPDQDWTLYTGFVGPMLQRPAMPADEAKTIFTWSLGLLGALLLPLGPFAASLAEKKRKPDEPPAVAAPARVEPSGLLEAPEPTAPKRVTRTIRPALSLVDDDEPPSLVDRKRRTK